MRIIYSDEAIFSLEEIVNFLIKHWTQKEIDAFETEHENFIINIKDKTLSYPKVDGFNNLNFALIGNKQVKVYFYSTHDALEIILFLPCKADPKKLKNLLK